MISRRVALRSAALLAAAVPVAPAIAFRIQEDGPDSPRVRLLLSGCETREAHARLAEELIAEFEGRRGRDKAVETVRAMSCPLCGCRLADGLPEGAAAPRF